MGVSAPLEEHFEQLAAAERAEWKGQHAAAVLGLALAASDAWWEHVEQVRAGRDALTVARAYGTGGRARIVAALLERAASEPPRSDAARLRVVNAGAVAYFPDEPAAASRAFRDDYRRRLVLGAESVARRGAGRCLACDGQLARDGARRDYCSPCEVAASVEEHGAAQLDRQRRHEAVRELFDAARRVVR